MAAGGPRHFLSFYTGAVAQSFRLSTFNSISGSQLRRKFSRETTSKENEGHGIGTEERAPSTLEEFQRLNQEKAELDKLREEKERRGFAETAKVQDGAVNDPSVETVKGPS